MPRPEGIKGAGSPPLKAFLKGFIMPNKKTTPKTKQAKKKLSRKISLLVREGRKPKQAVASAFSLLRRGKI